MMLAVPAALWGDPPSRGLAAPPWGPALAQTLAQASRDLYLLYRIHRRRRTQEFHFLSLV